MTNNYFLYKQTTTFNILPWNGRRMNPTLTDATPEPFPWGSIEGFRVIIFKCKNDCLPTNVATYVPQTYLNDFVPQFYELYKIVSDKQYTTFNQISYSGMTNASNNYKFPTNSTQNAPTSFQFTFETEINAKIQYNDPNIAFSVPINYGKYPNGYPP